MGVAAQQQVEVGVRRLTINLGRMRQQNREFAIWDLRGRFLDIVHAVVMGVVDPGEVQNLTVAQQRLGLVDQHADAHCFERRHHADRIGVAQDGIDRRGDTIAQSRHAGDRGFIQP